VIENKKRARIDQSDLETVIPSVGREVVILSGENRGQIAKLVKIESEKFRVIVKLDNEERKFPYEEVSKLYVKS